MENENNAQPAEQQLDISQIKSMLNLPDTASDLELITVLVNLIANLQEKYEGILKDAVALEDNLVNRELSDFSDVIVESTLPFWKEQILANRAVTVQALTDLRNRLAALPPQAVIPDNRSVPLRNRLAALEPPMEHIATGTAPQSDAVAVRIRNRASEISKADGVPFSIAFSRAEREIKE